MGYTFIAIEGNIGAGKTTLARALASELNADLVLEEFESNKALRKFYENINTPLQHSYALATELQFLIDRFLQLREFSSNKSLIIADYAPEKSSLFAKMNLSAPEYKVYADIFQLLMVNIPSPDCIIYLERKPSELQENIQKRARNYECSIDNAYLDKINQQYWHYLQGIKQKTHIISLSESYPTSKTIDFLKNELKLFL
jgi:deoxyguanosine kinase